MSEPRIVVLPPEIAEKIAAGEVIERPASVVKELVENAIDAGAKRITIEIEAGGKALIRVTDDGSGMTAEEAALAVQPHATSKLRTADDLFRIHTLGFRGEALPSIGAVARLSIQSRAQGVGEAYEIAVDGGRKAKLKPAALASGTRVEVRDLFYATPQRFLPGMDGAGLELLRQRYVLLASGTGAWEDIDESWRMADVLGARGIPNRVDNWGPDYEHEWPTWWAMLPQYLRELLGLG